MSEGQRRIARLAVDGHELPASRIMAESFTIDHGRGMLHMTVRFDALELEYSQPPVRGRSVPLPGGDAEQYPGEFADAQHLAEHLDQMTVEAVERLERRARGEDA